MVDGGSTRAGVLGGQSVSSKNNRTKVGEKSKGQIMQGWLR